MANIANRTSWKTEPIDNPKRIDISLHFTGKQFSKLTKVLIPKQMEDRWFAFYEKDYLYFHRSWTGFGIYEAQIKKEPEGYFNNEIWAERNREKYLNEDDQTDMETFTLFIAQGLLGINVRKIYFDHNIKTDSDSVKAWSNFGNLLFSDPVTD